MIDFSQVTDITLGSTPVEQVTDSQGNVLWSASVDPSTVYFYVEDVSGSDNTLSITKNGDSAPTIEVFKSTDQQNWSSMGSTSTTAITATVPANGKLYLKATANAWSSSGYYNSINATGDFNAGGNIMSLLYNDNFVSQTTLSANDTFIHLFDYSTNIVSAENLILPATTLSTGCYDSMFYSCIALTTAPALPATTLTTYCYTNMFSYCTRLTTAPALPATTLASGCYKNMFKGCTLTTAPALPATTLVSGCYINMFDGCTNLNSVTTYAESVTSLALRYWLRNVSQTGDFYNLGGATYPSGDSGIPTGWTIHTSL